MSKWAPAVWAEGVGERGEEGLIHRDAESSRPLNHSPSLSPSHLSSVDAHARSVPGRRPGRI